MDRSHLPTAVWSHVPDVTAVIGADGAVLWAGGPTERMLGLSADATAVMNLFDWLSPDDTDRVGHALQNAAASGSGAHVECRLRHRKGGWIVAELAAAPGLRPLGHGGAPALVVTLRELGERRRVDAIIEGVVRGRPLAQSLSDIAELVEAPVDRCGCAIYVINPADEGADMVATSGRLTWVVPELRSRRWLVELGPVGQAVVDRHPVAAQPGPQWGVDPVTSVADHLGADVAVALPFGESFGGRIAAGCLLIVGPVEQVNQLDSELVERWLFAASLAVDHHQRWEALTTVAGSDPVTGLVNRAGILNALAERLTHRPDGLGVLVMSVDGLAQLRARDGYVAGDQGLRLVAERLVRSADAGDLVGRLDGDDLVVLLSAHTPALAREKVSHLLQCCEQLNPGVQLAPKAGLVWAQGGRGLPEDHVALAASEAYASPQQRLGQSAPPAARPPATPARGLFGTSRPLDTKSSERPGLIGLAGLAEQRSTDAPTADAPLPDEPVAELPDGFDAEALGDVEGGDPGLEHPVESVQAALPVVSSVARPVNTTSLSPDRASLLTAAARRATAELDSSVSPRSAADKPLDSTPLPTRQTAQVAASRAEQAGEPEQVLEPAYAGLGDTVAADALAGDGDAAGAGRPGGARLRDWFRGGAR